LVKVIIMETAKKKGEILEVVFEKFMNRELGYSFTERNTFVNGKVATRAYEVDIHGKLTNPLYQNIKIIGFIIFGIALIQLLLGIIPEVEVVLENIFTSISPSLAGFSLLIISCLGIYIGLTGSKNSIEHTWVECKNLKSNVKRTHVNKLNNSVIDRNKYVKSLKESDNDWLVQKMIIVSAKSFDIDAKSFANEHGIICYEWNGKNKFKKIN
jgi:hypothetical protein